ncbi:MAG: glutamate racemase [Deltaproteobacteria bacterium]|nr:glutamate racemase [Deltaproteobacteria bacterium]
MPRPATGETPGRAIWHSQVDQARVRAVTPAAPIGVFDSGIGGLTVVAGLRRVLPREAILYLGDTARVPYGTKSSEVVRRYAHTCARFLLTEGAKMLVVACNTASAHALEFLRASFAVPVVGVIEPGAAMAARATRNNRIGVIGTEGTITSGSYQRALARLAPEATVIAKSCPLFVPLAEEGMVDHPATRLIATEYLAPFAAHEVDTVVLGCTHYPLLSPVLQQILGNSVELVDSASAVAIVVRDTLEANSLSAPRRAAEDRFFATDVSQRVLRVGRAFLGAELAAVNLVDL